MTEKFLAKLRRYDTVSAEEECALRSAMSEAATFEPGQTIVEAKTELSNSTLAGSALRRFKGRSPVLRASSAADRCWSRGAL